ncbi:MAG: HEAT repeat domain-containing protein [Thermoanaerobaculia bacterium]
MKRLLMFLVCTGCLAAMAQQPPSPAPGRPLAGEPLDALLKRRDAAAEAELGRRFEAAPDGLDKQRIAVVLVVRERDDDPYFNYLAGRARKAVGSTMPFPFEFDDAGRSVPKQLSAEFLTWAARNQVEPEPAAARAVRELPLDVFMLALTGDPRGSEILLKGLDSPNYMVVYRAAWGLAKLRMASAVPRIAGAAERAPEEARQLIARTLVLFDTPEAQAAAERLIKDKRILQELRENARQMLEAGVGDS